METCDILGDAGTIAAIRQAEADIAAGRISTLEEVEAEMKARKVA